MKNIVLVGFMGTGKTTIARALSKKLGMKYVSTDELIEKKEKASVREIFSEKGEGYFRKAEKAAVKDAAEMENAIIDAGGGAVKDEENMSSLRKKGVIICLWAEPEVILERTKKYAARPFARPLLNVENPLAKIKELLLERKPFYEKADCRIDTSKAQIEEVLNKVERIIKDAKSE